MSPAEPPDIVKCPGCSERVLRRRPRSGNTIGGRLWTDAKAEGEMLPDYHLLIRCPLCGHCFWGADVKSLGQIDGKSGLKVCEAPTDADYLAFVRDAELSADQEEYVRRRAWWLANDAIRYEADGKTTAAFTEEQIANMAALADVLDEGDLDQRIMKAELARERGLFDEALTLLDFDFLEHHVGPVEQIRELSRAGSSRVAEIPTDW